MTQSTHKSPFICWVDFPADNPERSKKFYSDVFGWKIEKDTHTQTSKSAPEYFMISIPEQPAMPPQTPHFLGGLLKRQHPQHTITVYIAVPSVDQYATKIKGAGGQVIVGKTAVPGMGYFNICQDTEHNVFAIWEVNKSAK